eukprot:GILI01003133.1.p1 GENE.GILI01003133.1~~GILI01003133.1.p1  ORF type:complete len:123 (+),score=25.28 GILI01003133.1:35-370(+)
MTNNSPSQERSVKYQAVSRDAIKQQMLQKGSKLRSDRRQNAMDVLRGSGNGNTGTGHLEAICGDFGIDLDEETLNFLLQIEEEIRNEELIRIHEEALALDDPELQYQYYMN